MPVNKKQAKQYMTEAEHAVQQAHMVAASNQGMLPSLSVLRAHIRLLCVNKHVSQTGPKVDIKHPLMGRAAPMRGIELCPLTCTGTFVPALASTQQRAHYGPEANTRQSKACPYLTRAHTLSRQCSESHCPSQAAQRAKAARMRIPMLASACMLSLSLAAPSIWGRLAAKKQLSCKQFSACCQPRLSKHIARV